MLVRNRLRGENVGLIQLVQEVAVRGERAHVNREQAGSQDLKLEVAVRGERAHVDAACKQLQSVRLVSVCLQFSFKEMCLVKAGI